MKKISKKLQKTNIKLVNKIRNEASKITNNNKKELQESFLNFSIYYLIFYSF